MNMIKLLLSIIPIIMVIMGASNVNGRTVTWIGKVYPNGYNSWNVASNWDAGEVPTSNDDVVVKFTNMSTLFIGTGYESYANTLTLSNVLLAIFAPFHVGKVVSTESEIIVYSSESTSVFGQVTIDKFVVVTEGSANVTSLVATDLYLYPSSNLTVTGSATIADTLFLTNGGIYGKASVRVGEVFVNAANDTSLPVPDVYRSNKQFYAKVVEHKQKLQQQQLYNEQTASIFYSFSENEKLNVQHHSTTVISTTDSSWSVIPGIISQVQIRATRFILYNPLDYPSVLLFEHLGTISTY